MEEQKPIISKELENSIRNLLNLSINIHDKLHGNKKQYWLTCVSKTFAFFSKVTGQEKFNKFFPPLFLNFYNKNKDVLDMPIFYDKDDKQLVNDLLFKSTELLPGPGIDPIKIKKNENSTDDSKVKMNYCTGLVLYLDENPDLKAICIPISEIYLSAIRFYKQDNSKSVSTQVLPTKVLLSIYNCIYYSMTEKSEKVKRNIDILTKYILDTEGETSQSSSSTSEFTKGMASMMNSLGISGDNLDPNQLGNTLNNFLGSETAANVKNLVGTLMTTVTNNPSNDPGSVISSIGEALQKPEINKMMTQTLEQSTSLLSTIPGMENITKTELPTANAKNQD